MVPYSLTVVYVFYVRRICVGVIFRRFGLVLDQIFHFCLFVSLMYLILLMQKDFRDTFLVF